MKKKLFASVIGMVVVTGILLSSTALAGKDGNGNGFPSGPHYNLNILGKNETKWEYNASEESNNTIFVRLDNQSLILMTPTKGTEFEVIDADAVSKEGGKYKYDAELLIPYNKSNDYYAYDVYVRARGKPNKDVNISANFTNLTDGTEWWDFGTVSLSHINGKGRPKPGTECINDLFYVEVDGFNYWLFDKPGYNETVYQYFWNYDNNGCKLLQVRFYENTSYTPPDPIT